MGLSGLVPVGRAGIIIGAVGASEGVVSSPELSQVCTLVLVSLGRVILGENHILGLGMDSRARVTGLGLGLMVIATISKHTPQAPIKTQNT